MTMQLEDHLREVLRDAPEPDWHAFRAAVEAQAARQRRGRMLRASLGGIAAAAAVVAVAMSVASTPLFDGPRATPAQSVTPSATGSALGGVPATTDFQPRVKLANGDYRLPMSFPDVAPQTGEMPGGLVRLRGTSDTSPQASVASSICVTTSGAVGPQPWGSASWAYRGADSSKVARPHEDRAAAVTLVGWPRGTAVTGMRQLDQNSGACTFDTAFDKIPWPGRAASEANQFAVDERSQTGGATYVAIRRVGDVTIDAWFYGGDRDTVLAQARSVVDKAVAELIASRTLDAPVPAVAKWAANLREPSPMRDEFILPAIAPSAKVIGLTGFSRRDPQLASAMGSVPVLGAQLGDTGHPGERAVAMRQADYQLPMPDQGEDGGMANTSVLWSSFPDGRKAFDEITADKGSARWWGPTTREAWPGHDEATTFLATQAERPRPLQIALRLEGDVLISVVAQGQTQAQARTIATTLADDAARNLAAFGRGPDGRPGNGR